MRAEIVPDGNIKVEMTDYAVYASKTRLPSSSFLRM